MEKNFLRITEAARKLGIHPSTLRDFENRGLITIKRNWVGWRVYTEEDIELLKKILYGDQSASSIKRTRFKSRSVDG